MQSTVSPEMQKVVSQQSNVQYNTFRVVGGISLPFFQVSISQWKKGFKGLKFCDFSKFIMNLQKIKKK